MRLSVLFFLVVNALRGFAQVSSTGPQPLYDGQTVTAVDLIANPHRDVEPLRAYLAQQAGTPYSEAKVEASISALQEKGGFEKVTVGVIPDVSGLRLNFILEPAYVVLSPADCHVRDPATAAPSSSRNAPQLRLNAPAPDRPRPARS